jgi:hypothetical protein
MRCSFVSSFTVCEIVCCSVTFGEALRSVGAKVTTVLYPDKTHTDLFLQVFFETLLMKLVSLLLV